MKTFAHVAKIMNVGDTLVLDQNVEPFQLMMYNWRKGDEFKLLDITTEKDGRRSLRVKNLRTTKDTVSCSPRLFWKVLTQHSN